MIENNKNKKEITKQKLIESAAREFALNGYERANINIISEKAGFGKGTVYNYFKNKRSLLIEVIRYATHLVSLKIRDKISQEKDIKKKLYLVIYSHFEFAVQEEALLKVLIQEGYSASSKVQNKIINAMEECYELIIKIIEEGKKKKLFLQQIDNFVTANILVGMLFHHDCTCWALKGEIKDIKKETEIIFNQFFYGILKRLRENDDE
ncbi:MAG: TetR/AcrR family transcriptional regulator [Candidatus Firestonebacteria bacterium]|nr:TetR/AcrR family transcriptional regulator [Candidatus Firestonebacteria bacterium]